MSIAMSLSEFSARFGPVSIFINAEGKENSHPKAILISAETVKSLNSPPNRLIGIQQCERRLFGEPQPRLKGQLKPPPASLRSIINLFRISPGNIANSTCSDAAEWRKKFSVWFALAVLLA